MKIFQVPDVRNWSWRFCEAVQPKWYKCTIKLKYFVTKYRALHFCFVNFGTHWDTKYLLHSRFTVLFPCVLIKMKVVWLCFILHTAGRPVSDAQLFSLTLGLILMAVTSPQLIYFRGTSPPRQSLVRSRWRCEVSPSAPQKTHKEAGPSDWSFREVKV